MGDEFTVIWTPELKFVCCFFLSSFFSLCWELNSDEKRTFLQILGATFLYGGAGAGFGGIMGRYITGKQFPALEFACGILVGARAVPMDTIGPLVMDTLANIGRYKDETREDRRKRRNERSNDTSNAGCNDDSNKSGTPSDKK